MCLSQPPVKITGILKPTKPDKARPATDSSELSPSKQPLLVGDGTARTADSPVTSKAATVNKSSDQKPAKPGSTGKKRKK